MPGSQMDSDSQGRRQWPKTLARRQWTGQALLHQSLATQGLGSLSYQLRSESLGGPSQDPGQDPDVGCGR